MNQEQEPARPRLSAEWRLVVTLADSGVMVCFPVAGQKEAVDRARRSGHQTWHIEKRYVTDWKLTTRELRSAILVAGRPKPKREVEPFVIDPGAEPPCDGMITP